MSPTRTAPDARPLLGTAASPSVVLFLAMFAAQSSLLVLTPILPDVAVELGVSTSLTAQLRSITGLTAGAIALWVGLRSRPRPFRDILAIGLLLLAVSAAASAAAPTFGVLAAAQFVAGFGLGFVLSGALAAAGGWAPDRQASTLSWALAGQPTAWIVGMPLVGVVAEASWRYAWLAVPLAASLLALAVLFVRERDPVPDSHPEEPPMWGQPGTKGWALGELLAYGGWAGTLVFVGALFIDRYGTSVTVVGLLLAAAAVAYLPGNFLARRLVVDDPGRLLIAASAASAVGVAVLVMLRPSMASAATLFAAVAFVAGARTLAGSSMGLRLAPQCPLQSMGFRTAAVQYGYLLGAALGGIALALGGYPALGAALATLYLAAAGTQVGVRARRRGLLGGGSRGPSSQR